MPTVSFVFFVFDAAPLQETTQRWRAVGNTVSNFTGRD